MSWLRIPDEILLKILSYLSEQDLVSLGQVCKRWHVLSQDEYLWKSLLSLHYPYNQPLPSDDSLSRSTPASLDVYRSFRDNVASLNVQVATQHSDEVLHVSFSHNGRLVCSTSKDATACLWSVTTAYTLDLVDTLVFFSDLTLPYKHTVYSEFNQDDTMLLVYGTVDHIPTGGIVYIYDLKQQKFLSHAVTRPLNIFSTWLDSQHFAYGDIMASSLEPGGSESILYCSNARRQAGDYKQLGRFYNRRGTCIRQIRSMPLVDMKAGSSHSNCGSDYRLFYSKGDTYRCGHQLACCDVTTERLPPISSNREFITSTHKNVCEVNGRVVGLRMSPDNQLIYINCRPFTNTDAHANLLQPDISENAEVRVYRSDSLELVQMLRGHKCYTPKSSCFIIHLDVSESYIASGAEDRLVHVWDRRSGAKLATLCGHTNVVNAVAFNPRNEGMLVSASDDFTLRVWHSRHLVRSCKELRVSNF
ncbi:F-box/WD repeat-containing protein 5-like [Corticium candelabrum]|uniref:F-box/WD repeat-containing protein 5-like n=1 Tax=Corticium candelabrum TaxID=121492 RepID=UPI002E35755B|nr:F-box/WD repeat-containing protein 5-like [Corticium candelabrum]